MGTANRTAHPTALLIAATALFYALDLIKDLFLYAVFGPARLDAFYGATTVLEAGVRALMLTALSAALMPVLAKAANIGGEELAVRVSAAVACLAAIALSAVAAVGIAFAPQILMIYGFSGSIEGVIVARLVFASLPLFGIEKILRTSIERRGQFGAPVAASLISRLAFLAVIFVFASSGVMSAGLGAFVAASVSLVVMLFSYGRRWQPARLGHPLVGEAWRLLVPLGLAGFFAQSALIDRLFASYLGDGALSILRLANIIYDVPITLFCVSIGVAFFPRMCESASAGAMEELRAQTATALRRALFFTLPAMAGVIALARPLIAVVYERGEFTSADTTAASTALIAYAVGLAGAAVRPILSRTLFALGKHRFFVPLELTLLILNAALNYLFAFTFGWGLWGIALSTAVVSYVDAIVVWLLVRRVSQGGMRVAPAIVKMAFAAAVTGVVAYFLWSAPFGPPAVRLAVAIGLGAIIYFAITAAFRLDEVSHCGEIVRKIFRRTK